MSCGQPDDARDPAHRHPVRVGGGHADRRGGPAQPGHRGLRPLLDPRPARRHARAALPGAGPLVLLVLDAGGRSRPTCAGRRACPARRSPTSTRPSRSTVISVEEVVASYAVDPTPRRERRQPSSCAGRPPAAQARRAVGGRDRRSPASARIPPAPRHRRGRARWARPWAPRPPGRAAACWRPPGRTLGGRPARRRDASPSTTVSRSATPVARGVGPRGGARRPGRRRSPTADAAPRRQGGDGEHPAAAADVEHPLAAPHEVDPARPGPGGSTRGRRCRRPGRDRSRGRPARRRGRRRRPRRRPPTAGGRPAPADPHGAGVVAPGVERGAEVDGHQVGGPAAGRRPPAAAPASPPAGAPATSTTRPAAAGAAPRSRPPRPATARRPPARPRPPEPLTVHGVRTAGRVRRRSGSRRPRHAGSGQREQVVAGRVGPGAGHRQARGRPGRRPRRPGVNLVLISVRICSPAAKSTTRSISRQLDRHGLGGDRSRISIHWFVGVPHRPVREAVELEVGAQLAVEHRRAGCG